MRRFIIITTEVVGFHHWPEAPDRRAYLRAVHRHVFKVVVGLQVKDGDREVEFHDLQEFSREWLDKQGRDFGTNSCEQIAAALLHLVQDEYPGRSAWVQVWEDGECGAQIEVI